MSWDDTDTRFFHFRDKGGTEVDFVLYDGETGVSFGDGLFAVPIGRLWDAT